jgi:hypothetical protein
MTSLPSLIADLESRGIILSLVDGEIRYRSPKNALTDSDREGLRSRRAQIIHWLAARDAARAIKGINGAQGPLTVSVGQEMWWRFAGGAEEGKPIALNIGMVSQFRASPEMVTAAVRQVITRYDALRVSFRAQGEVLIPSLNPAEAFEIEQEDFRSLGGDAASAAAQASAREFCARTNYIEGNWLTRAKVIALPEGEAMAVISSAHMIADAGTRNIIIDEIRDILESGAPLAGPSVLFNAYSLAERELLDGASGRGADRLLAPLVRRTAHHVFADGKNAAAMGQWHPHGAQFHHSGAGAEPGARARRSLESDAFCGLPEDILARHGALVGDGPLSRPRAGRQAHRAGSGQHRGADVLRRRAGNPCAAGAGFRNDPARHHGVL